MAPSLERITLGRIAAFSSSPTDGVTERFRPQDWDPATGITVALSSSNLRFSAGSGLSRRWNRFVGVPDEEIRADAFVQCVWVAKSTGGGAGPGLRFDNQAIPGAGVGLQVPSGFSGTETLVESDATPSTVQQVATSSIDRTLPERLSLMLSGTDAKSYNHDAAQERTLSGVAVADGAACLYYSSGGSANAIDYSQFYYMRSHVLRVVGPAGNWRARVKNGAGTVLAEALSSSGVASVDLFAARINFPDATRLEVYDDDTASVIVSIDPGARLWGGDEWRYYADTPATPEGSVVRASTGKLFAFDESGAAPYEAFDLADWTAESGISLSLSSGRLRLSSSSINIFQRIAALTAAGSLADLYAQVVVSATGGTAAQAGAIGRKSGLYTSNVGIYADASYSDAFGTRLLERNSADVQSELFGSFTHTGPARQTLWLHGTEADAFNYSSYRRTRLTGLVVTAAGDFGVELNRGSVGSVDYGQVLLMSSAIVTVNGPTAFNWRARIRDSAGEVLAYADAVAGVAEIDLHAARARVPNGYTVDVVDMDDPTFAILGTADMSTDRVWGGDVYTFAIAPATPDAPTITVVGSDSISLEWDAVTDADTYSLERATNPAGPWTEVFDGADLDFTDTGLDPETEYFYRLSACNEGGCSDPSATNSETTLAEIPAIPGAPTIDNATSSSLRVNWTPLAYAPAGYDVWRSLTEVGGYSLVGSVLAGVGTFTDTGLAPETEYFYRISACSSAGCSDLSAAGSGTTAAEALYPPCTLILEVYEADGTTIAWEVATDRAHPFPYLLFPSNYGSREIDPVSGAASIATVDVTIADVAQTPGNQRTGFVTERIAGIFGRRCRLRRFISETLGFYVVADGPASTPRLSESYAGYTFAIRDTRETERRLRAFSSGGTCAIVPTGPVADWGNDGEGNYLLEGVTPIVGKTLIQFNSTAGEYVGQVLFNDLYDFTSTPGTPQMPASVVIGEDGEEALKFVSDGARAWFPNADVLWRLAGSSDPFNVARPDAPLLYAYRLGGVQPGVIAGTSTAVRGLLSLLLWWDPAGPPAGFPTEDNVELEIILRHRGAASEELPYYYEGNLGDLLAKLYDRELERAPSLGGDVYDPQGLDDPASASFGGGVRYDPAAIAALTTPVLLRATEAVDDGRDWAESKLYAPAGFIPSIDAAGLVSPVSRARPSVITGPEINDAVAEPAPDWNAGERVVTAVRYTYPRYFIPGSLANIETGADGLAVRDVVIEFRDPAAEDKHGEQIVEYDASAFGAVAAPSTSIIDPGGLPIEGVPETGSILAAEARYEVLERYRDGAPAFRVAVRRSDFPTLRDGDYCPTNLSWLPDLAATLRGLEVEAVQVLSIEGLDCEWLTLLLEVTPVVAVPGFYSNGDKTDDDPVPGFYSGGDLTSDVPSEGS
jgi:hypothetical protein